MENRQYTLSLQGTFYTLEQLRKLSLEPDSGADVRPGALPDLPQIAFAGRSNVGKSSLINALAGRKGLAKVSSTPGKTSSINFYMAQSNAPGFNDFYLVDLPGYGYAKRSKAERIKWDALINAYLQNSKRLAALCVLLDCRLEPQDSDLNLIAFARSINLKLLPLLTKADKCGSDAQAGRKLQWTKLLAGQSPLLTSALPEKPRSPKEEYGQGKRRTNLDQVWEAMHGLAAQG
ncbi:MAG: ribosome biogenesis GTP-binding protein YihA/YsxC [Deltaproteobacteria bacterium]|jgi:GTP-binding protein|nr:ribosome biogenesis GTP-binding protein YihA/YsxC [Deltaproteobacteria bacterium]